MLSYFVYNNVYSITKIMPNELERIIIQLIKVTDKSKNYVNILYRYTISKTIYIYCAENYIDIQYRNLYRYTISKTI